MVSNPPDLELQVVGYDCLLGAGNLKSTTGHRQGFHVCQRKGSLSGKISFDGQASDLMWEDHWTVADIQDSVTSDALFPQTLKFLVYHDGHF